MATITVNTLVDELDGSIFDGDVSLRDALAVASAGDVITFSSAFQSDRDPLNNQTILLTLGQINIGVDVTINGDVNGDGIADIEIDGMANTGIFEVTTSRVDLVLAGLTLTNADNAASGGAVDFSSSGGSLVVANSNFVGNVAQYGGAIRSSEATLIVNSYFSGNNAGDAGGAVSLEAGGTIVNSTFTQNNASVAGGIYAPDGTVTLISSTITGNQATTAGGVLAVNLDVSNSIILANNAGNNRDLDVSSLTSNGHNIFGNGVTGIAAGDQLLGIASLPQVFDSVGPVTVGGVTFDAGQVSLTQGITPVIGIAAGGLAENAGDNSDIPTESGLGLDVDNDGAIEGTVLEIDASGFNRITGGTVDIGASESVGGIWIVDTADDVDDGNLTTGNLSLREAVNAAADGDRITFDSSVFTADGDERTNTAIALTGTLFIFDNKAITLDGDVNDDGIADVTIDGALSSSRMLQLGSESGLAVESVTFANSDVTLSGGVISTRGNLSVLNSTFTNNTTTSFGGAIRVYDGFATIANSTFDGNKAQRGGAIRATEATVQVFNSTFYGNHASITGSRDGGGGALEVASGILYLTNSTVTGNSSASVGGGVTATGGIIGFENSIVVGNVRNGSFLDDIISSTTSVSNGGNVFGSSNISGTGDIVNESVTDVFDSIVNVSPGGIFASAGALGDNGGATDTVLILQGGVAVDQGESGDINTETSLGMDVDGDGDISGTVVIDQRGGPRELGESVDAGAVEVNSDLIIVTSTEDTRDGDTSLDDISWREALELVSDGGTITFDETVFLVDDDPLMNTVISLTNAAEDPFAKGFHMDGDLNDDGIADVTFDGAGSSDEWMRVSSPYVSLMTLEGLTFRNFNDVSNSGGVLRTASDLFVRNSDFVDNTSQVFGGALRLYSYSEAVIANSYFSGNLSDRGGAIRTTANMTVIGSTFTRNATDSGGFNASGGAIENTGDLRIINSTITGNYAVEDGGGVSRSFGTLEILNSIVAGNAAGGVGNDVECAFTSSGANIFGVGQTGTAVGDLVLAGASDLAEVFDVVTSVTTGGARAFTAGVAADNGGTGPTVALRANLANPALDAADPAALDENLVGIDLNFDGDTTDTVTFDGRGFARAVDVPGVANNGTSTVDIGAIETQTTPTPGPDILQGIAGAETLSAGGGSDLVDLGLGDDTGDGGAGIDTLSFASLAAPGFVFGDIEVGVIVDLSAQGTAQNTGQGNDI
ncbi:MAG: beta strand repeat-containing protein, partial [Paracoccaceae bacterium]